MRLAKAFATVVAVLLAGCSLGQQAAARDFPQPSSSISGARHAVAEFIPDSDVSEVNNTAGRPYWHAADWAIGSGNSTPAGGARGAARVTSVPAVAGFGTLIPGIKVKGGNVVVKSYGGSWGGLFSEWDWDNWIKPQVDRARALGMNTIRLIGNPGIIFMAAGENYPAITLEQYIARWRQLADYTKSLGMMLYPALCEKWAFWDGTTFDFANADRIDAIKAVAKALAPYPNVIGFDVFQEGSGKDDGLTVNNVLDLYGAIRSVAPGIPLTTSNSSDGFGNPEDFWSDQNSIQYQAWTAKGGADFIDIHVYLDNVDVSNLSNFSSLGKPILVGEFGTPQSLTPAEQVGRIVSGKDLHNLPGVLGSIVWGLADQGTADADKIGIWDNSGFSQGGSPLSTKTGQRTSLTDLLGQFD